MADFVIDAGLKLDATAALNSVKQLGKFMDDAFGKQSKLNVDTTPVEKDIKELGKLAEKTFDGIGDSVGKSFASSQGGLFDGLKKSFKEGQDLAGSGGGIFGSLASGVGQLASPIGLATAALGTFTAAASVAFTEYRALDKNIQNIGTLGVEASGLSLTKFEGLITDLSTRVPDTASNIANGVYNAISAGITGSEETIVGFAEIASKVAVAGLSDTNAAVNGLTSVVNAYGTGAAGAKEASNVFFATIKAGKTSFNELNAGLANVVPAASAAGISFKEVGATIAKLTTVGIPTAQATTQIRQAIIELQKPGKELAGELAKIGLNAGNMAAQLKKPIDQGGGLINTLQKLEASAKKSGKSLVQVFSSSEAVSAANSLTGNNAASTNAILAGLNADVAANVADKAFDSAAQGIDVKINIIKNKVQGVFNNIFATLKPIVTDIFNIVSDVFGKISDAVAPIFAKLSGTLGQAFSRIGAVLKPILAVIGGLISVGLVGSLTFFGNVANTLYSTLVQIFDGIVVAVQPIVDAFKKAFNISDDVTKTFDPLQTLQKIFEAVTTTINDYFAIVSAVASFLVTVFVEALKAVVNVLVFAYDGIVKTFQAFGFFKDEIKGVGTETEKAGGFFTTLINIIKNAPAIINAITAGFKAFTGAIGDLINDFSFDKLKDLVTGKTFTKAFGDSLNTEVAKKNADAQVKLFEEKIKLLAKLDGEAFNNEKARLLKAVETKTAILGANNAKELTQKINGINLASTAQTKAETEAAAQAAKEKGEKLKDIQKDLDKLQRDINRTSGEAANIARRQETTEAQKAREKALDDLKKGFEDSKQALIDANKEKQEDEKISAKQKLLFKQLTDNLIIAKEKELNAKISVVNAEFAEKERQAALKADDELLKLKIELAKKRVEASKEKVTNNSDEERARIKEQNQFEIELLQVTAERKYALAVTSNADVVKADDELKAAIISNNEERIAIAKKHYDEVTKLALETDGFIIEERKKTALEIDLQNQKSALQSREFEASLIVDTEERNREIKLIEVDKTLVAELAKSSGNEVAKNEAYKKAVLERIKIEEDFAKQQSGIFDTVKNNIVGLFGTLGGSISEAFKPISAEQQKATETAKAENEKQLTDLKASLKARTLSFEEYQNKVADIAKKNDELGKKSGFDFGKAFADGLQKSLQSIADVFNKNADGFVAKWQETEGKFAAIDKQIAKANKKKEEGTVEERAQAVKDLEILGGIRTENEKKSADETDAIMLNMGASVVAGFASIALSMSSSWQDYVLITLNALEQLVPVFTAMILGKQLAELSFGGLITAGFLIASLTAAAELAKSAVNSSKGFFGGGYTGDGERMETAGVVHKGEHVFEKPIVYSQRREFTELHNLLRGGTNLGQILHAYKYPELSNISVGANGKLHNNTFVIAPINHQRNDANIINELQNQTLHLSRKLDTVIDAQREMPNAFRGKMNVGLDIYHDDTITTKRKALDIRRKALQ